MDFLDKIRKKQKYLDKTTHNLSEKSLPSKEMPEKKRKSEKKSDKTTQNQTIGKTLKYKLFCVWIFLILFINMLQGYFL